MPGIKGRSGRKPAMNEKSLEELLSLSNEILGRWLSNKEIPDERKIPVVAQIIIKRIPAKLEHSGEMFRAVIVNYADRVKANESISRHPNTV